MITIKLKDHGHLWEKQNLVTQVVGKKHYDFYKCANCGIKGRSATLSLIEIKASVSMKKITTCNGQSVIPTRIRITKCKAFGNVFNNLTPSSEHNVINPPEGYTNDVNGVWVMGVGEPVRVLSDEFTAL